MFPGNDHFIDMVKTDRDEFGGHSLGSANTSQVLTIRTRTVWWLKQKQIIFQEVNIWGGYRVQNNHEIHGRELRAWAQAWGRVDADAPVPGKS